MSALADRVCRIATLAAISACAYALADVVHEGVGHGGACLLLGGRVLLLSSTYEDCSLHGRLIDAAGPLVGIFTSAAARTWLRFRPSRSISLRLFLILLFAFTAFWNLGYLIKSGATDTGDWAFVIAGLQPHAVWRAGLIVAGVLGYGVAMRMLGPLLIGLSTEGDGGERPLPFALIPYLSGVLLAGAAGLLDPFGPMRMLTDALPSALAAIGLIWIGYDIQRRLPTLRLSIPSSVRIQMAGAAIGVAFVLALGPGLRF